MKQNGGEANLSDVNCSIQSDETKPKPTKRQKSSFAGILKVFCIGSILAVSLLAFPSVLPFVVAVWIVWHLILVHRERPAYLPLVAGLVILLVKFLPRTPASITLSGLMLALIVIRMRTSMTLPRRATLCTSLALIATWTWFYVEWQVIQNCGRELTFDPSRSIVCLGDSLTDGMLPDHGFPDPLSEMLKVEVINLGTSGIATSQGLGQMQRLFSHDPQLVIVELGGHDFLQGKSRDQTKANLLQIIEQCRLRNAEVVLMEIPRGFMFDPFWALEREIAYETDVQLVSDTWLREIVLMSPYAPPGRWMPDSRLSDDGIHSNARGSKAIAQHVANAIHQMYGDSIFQPGYR
ncbi:GDSL-type esterase/lipase family protein [Rhodopirellula baltica]|uniref:Lipolytic protein G-D-S-L family n=1 Tax=Rhodopirellula baltica SWK14 TaxID=993516 RepID=L7CMC8_RHOBT|nr:GDSL-type esterase/lipase family protein [Rhodopirellula baltica]ELP34236.1 lipolytic protein G-D-S-L family [Rhodopirellula baltica SWK14]